MMRIVRGLVIASAIGLMIGGCDSNELTESDLAQIVDRDGIAFTGESLAPAFLDRLAANRLVIIGERHFLREHHRFVVQLIRDLHGRGFRQLLLEWPHMANWLVTDYITDGDLVPGWEPPNDLYFDLLQGVRDFNRTLDESDRFSVVGIDVNLSDYGGASSFRGIVTALTGHLSPAGPLSTFLQGTYGVPEEQMTRINALLDALDADRSSLRSAWGGEWFDTVSEMATVEALSITIRSTYETDYDRAAKM